MTSPTRGRVVVGVLAASAFGPYLVAGIRTDQIVTYALAGFMLPLALVSGRPRPAVVALTTAWVAFTAVAVIGWLGNTDYARAGWAPGNLASNADNLALPLAVVVIVLALKVEGRTELLETVTRVVTVGVTLNALLGIGQFAAPGVVNPLVARFWGSGDTGERALTLERFTGIAGQPSISGVLYSIGLVCAIYALRNRTALRAAVILVVVLGGVLTVSKGLLFVGLPVVAFQLLRSSRKGSQRLAVLLFVGVGAAVVDFSGVAQRWSGYQRLVGFLPGGDRSGFTDYTGNRYGDAAVTRPLMSDVLNAHPWFGYGMRGLAAPVDTATVQAMVLAGIFGVGCVLVAQFVPLIAFWADRHTLDPAMRLLYGGVAVLVAALSFGTPPLTANRVSLLLWLLLALLLNGAGRRVDQPVTTTASVPSTAATP